MKSRERKKDTDSSSIVLYYALFLACLYAPNQTKVNQSWLFVGRATGWKETEVRLQEFSLRRHSILSTLLEAYKAERIAA